MKLSRFERPCLWFTTVTVWPGIAIQTWVFFTPENLANPYFIANYYSYFTQQSNLLVGLVCIYLLWRRNRQPGKWARLFVFGALINITITFVVYQTVLAPTWDPEGWEHVADLCVHVINPLMFAAYWLIFYEKSPLNYKAALGWLVYPAVFLAYTLLRAPLAGNFYPYPFIHAINLTPWQVFLNSLALGGVFLVFILLFRSVNNYLYKRLQVPLDYQIQDSVKSLNSPASPY